MRPFRRPSGSLSMGLMQRRHLFELNDEPWAPAPLRDAIIETLSLALRLGGAMRGVVEPLRDFVAASGADEILDLCAGAGGPAQVLAHELGARLGAAAPRIVLTDLYPRVEAWSAVRDGAGGLVDFVPEPVDATHIPAAVARSREGDGPPRARIVLNAFHHFEPRLARSILEDAVRSGAGIFVQELFERSPLQFLSFAPAGLAALALHPLVTKRDRAAKIALGWLTPISLLAGAWDGFVSTLRMYDEADLRAMVAPFGDGYTWTWGRFDYPVRGKGWYFHGVPRSSPARVDETLARA